MKGYFATTGVLFLLLAVAHGLRIFQEPHLARDVWFLLTTVVALALAAWALRLYRHTFASSTVPSKEG